jgi:FkbM family methyltransferase
MSSVKKYIQLFKHVANWPLYFKRRHEKGLSARYTTRGTPLLFDVPPAFYEVFREIFMEDFYRMNDLITYLDNKPVVVDIGGNVGYFSFLLSAKKPGAMVYAFEPMSENAAVFRQNISLNPGLEKHIIIAEKAVTGNNNEHVDIFFDSQTDNSVVASLVKDFSSLNTSVKRVACISLDRIISENKLKQIDLLKVDCEGSEYAIFYDSPAHIFDMVNVIAIETHELDRDTRNTTALISFLEGKGFTVESFIAENNCFYVKAYRKN